MEADNAVSESETELTKARRRGAGLILRGLCMGTADVIPGVSGGTMALITGIYDELVATIAGINAGVIRSFFAARFAELLVRLNVGFLLPLLAGIFIAVVSLARAITYLLETYPVPTWGFLTGLILASAYVVGRRIEGWGVGSMLALAAGVGIGYGVTMLLPMQTGVEWYKFTLSGAVASIAMILPGISGSFLLVLLGKYQQVLSAIHERDLFIIFFFGCGFLAGILAFSRLLKRLLASHHNTVMTLLVGLMLGSVRKVWPWRRETATQVKVWVGGSDETVAQAVEEMSKLPMDYECVLPAQLTMTVGVTLALLILGITLVVGLEQLAGRRAADD